MRTIQQSLIIAVLFAVHQCHVVSAMNFHGTCTDQPLTFDVIDEHFLFASDLYFLFGIDIHRPFINEFDQSDAEATVFIVVVCNPGSADCVERRGSLPPAYQLELIVNGVPFTDKHEDIDRQWHRVKMVNYDFLYEAFHSHAWYDDSDNNRDSVWKKFIMNMHSNGPENINAKWVEFPVKISDAGIQLLEGQQLRNNVSVQQFTFHYFVPTSQCRQPPVVYFDDYIARQAYLSAFHFQLLSDKCHLHTYTCHLRMQQIQYNASGAGVSTSELGGAIEITTNRLSVTTKRIFREQSARSTNLIDHISELLMIDNNTQPHDTEIYRNATCANTNPVTTREFVLCAQDNIFNEASARGFRIDVILCHSPTQDASNCRFALYNNVLRDPSRLFLPIRFEDILYVGFLRLPQSSDLDEWKNHQNKDFDKLYISQLGSSNDHVVKIRTDLRSDATITRTFQITSDQAHICQLACREHCIQPNLVQDFNGITFELTLLEFFIPTPTVTTSLSCVTSPVDVVKIEVTFHRVDPDSMPRPFSCAVTPTKFYPYHDTIAANCTSVGTPADYLVWAVTTQNGETIRVMLNPTYLTNIKTSNRAELRIDGVPHGDSVVLQVTSASTSFIDVHELTVLPLTDALLKRMNIALGWNHFSSAQRLMEEYLKIYEHELYLFDNSSSQRLPRVGLNRTSFLTSVLDYYRSMLNYMDGNSLHAQAKDFSQKIFSILSTHLLRYQDFHPSPGNNYSEAYLTLLSRLAARPEIVTYQTYHLLRHTLRLIALSLPDQSLPFLTKLFDLCLILRSFVNGPESLPMSTITDASSLFLLKQTISQVFIAIYNQSVLQGYTDSRMHYADTGPIDFIVRMTEPFLTQRWTLTYSTPTRRSDDDLTRDSRMTAGIIYYPKEYIALNSKATAVDSLDYLLGQLLAVDNRTLPATPIRFSQVLFSLQHDHLNTSNLLQQYFANIRLARVERKHYAHRFTFQTNTTELARNLSLVFLELPNAESYVFTVDIAYNRTCTKSSRMYQRNVRYTAAVNLWRYSHFVYSMPIRPSAFVCGQVEITSKQGPIRDPDRQGKFLVLESGCYSFNSRIYEEYYNNLQTNQCYLINENTSTLNGNMMSIPHLGCRCHPSVENFFLLCHPKSILVEYEVNGQTWLHFYIYISVLLLIFLLLGLYVIYKDTLDDYKPLVYFVADNQIGAITSHTYQLTVFTGLQQSTSKDFRIFVRLIGEKCHDVAHCLNLNVPDAFQPGGVDQFLLTSYVDIGRVVAVNMWHGEIDAECDFYIRHCILYDYRRRRTYYFCCYTWLSLRKGLNLINEIFYVAQEVDQYAFGHLFLSTYSWLSYHYHLLSSIFCKQRTNTLSRTYRLHLSFCCAIFQLYIIKLILISCRSTRIQQRCLYVFPSFLFLVDQSFEATGWIEIYKIIRMNILSSLFLAVVLASVFAVLVPVVIWVLTLLTNYLELYRQLLGAGTDYPHSSTLHSAVDAIASSISDFNSYQQDVEQFEYTHKFDLQHHLSISTIGGSEEELDGEVAENNSAIDDNNKNKDDEQSPTMPATNREMPIVTKEVPLILRENSNTTLKSTGKPSGAEQPIDENIDQRSVAPDASQLNVLPENQSTPTIKLRVNWPDSPSQPSFSAYVFHVVVYYVISFALALGCLVCMYSTLKSFIEVENYFLTSTILFIHLTTVVFTLVVELLCLLLAALLNATLFHITDEDKFVAPAVVVPTVPIASIKQQKLNHTFTLSRDVTLTDAQLRDRIRERFLESSIMVAVRDVIGYVLFMVIITLVFAERSRNVETHLTMRQYTSHLLREDIFRNIDHLPDTITWLHYFLEDRMFQGPKNYSCPKELCNHIQIPDSPLYLSKTVRIRQVRVTRRNCPKKIDALFHPLAPPTCFVGVDDLPADKAYVLHDQQQCTGWNSSLASTPCADVCNYTAIWSAVKTRDIVKFYKSFESPWYFMLYLSPKQTIERCDRKQLFYELHKHRWFDDKTAVILVEGNLYSPQTSSMVSFAWSIEKNEFGLVEKHIFIEESDYVLTSTGESEDVPSGSHALWALNGNVHDDDDDDSDDDDADEDRLVLTHYLFAALLCVLLTTKLLGVAKFTRNFGLYGLVFFLRTLSNVIDGLLLVLCGYYFLLFYFDHKVLQLNNLAQSLNIQQLFVSFRVLVVNNKVLNHLIGLICLVAIFKLLYLLKFNPKTFLLAETIYKSAEGFGTILFFAFLNYFMFTLIGRLLFPTEENFRSFSVAFRVVLISSIKDAASTDNIIPVTMVRALWQLCLWLFSAKIIEYFLISFVVQKFSHVRKDHQPTDEEKMVGRIFHTFWTYFAINKK